MGEPDRFPSFQDLHRPDTQDDRQDDHTITAVLSIVMFILFFLKFFLCCCCWLNKPEKFEMKALCDTGPPTKSIKQAQKDSTQLSHNPVTLSMPPENGSSREGERKNATAREAYKDGKYKSLSIFQTYLRNCCVASMKTRPAPNQSSRLPISDALTARPGVNTLLSANIMCESETDSKDPVLADTGRSPRPALVAGVAPKTLLIGPMTQGLLVPGRKRADSDNLSLDVDTEANGQADPKEIYQTEIQIEGNEDLNANQYVRTNILHSPGPGQSVEQEGQKLEDLLFHAAMDNSSSPPQRDGWETVVLNPSSKQSKPISSSISVQRQGQTLPVEMFAGHVVKPHPKGNSHESRLRESCADTAQPFPPTNDKVEFSKAFHDVRGPSSWLSAFGSVFTVPSVSEWLRSTATPKQDNLPDMSLPGKNPVEQDDLPRAVYNRPPSPSKMRFHQTSEENPHEIDPVPPVAVHGLWGHFASLPHLISRVISPSTAAMQPLDMQDHKMSHPSKERNMPLPQTSISQACYTKTEML
ncbi:uncharacterized protein [Ambystoma mexicanum]|uniref:uncharacterized protein n=1 Tax=Ambystoma mexicanum TaxID=8296 RepID=UPI0037E9AACE